MSTYRQSFKAIILYKLKYSSQELACSTSENGKFWLFKEKSQKFLYYQFVFIKVGWTSKKLQQITWFCLGSTKLKVQYAKCEKYTDIYISQSLDIRYMSTHLCHFYNNIIVNSLATCFYS